MKKLKLLIQKELKHYRAIPGSWYFPPVLHRIWALPMKAHETDSRPSLVLGIGNKSSTHSPNTVTVLNILSNRDPIRLQLKFWMTWLDFVMQTENAVCLASLLHTTAGWKLTHLKELSVFFTIPPNDTSWVCLLGQCGMTEFGVPHLTILWWGNLLWRLYLFRNGSLEKHMPQCSNFLSSLTFLKLPVFHCHDFKILHL